MYKVRIERKVQKKIEKISESYYTKIKLSILALGDNPRPKGHIKLKGKDAFRIRVGNFRIIYEIHDIILLVDVIDVGHRSDRINQGELGIGKYITLRTPQKLN